jgi:hypothetical protein
MGFLGRLFGRDRGSRSLQPLRSRVIVRQSVSPQHLRTQAVAPQRVGYPQAATTQAPDEARPASLARFTDYPLVGDSRMAVVGESHYQDAIRDAVHGESREDGIEVEARIVREPTNAFDPNAVRIDVNGRTVGYIARTEAPLLRPRLIDLERQGLRPVCRASVFGGSPDKPNYGIWLRASFALVGLGNQLPVGDVLRLRGSWMTNVSGEEFHQDVLEPLAAAADTLAYLFATLAICEIANGKYAGLQAVEVRINGQRVGELTRAMTERYWPDVEHALASGRSVIAEAILRREAKIEVYLLMPAHK